MSIWCMYFMLEIAPALSDWNQEYETLYRLFCG